MSGRRVLVLLVCALPTSRRAVDLKVPLGRLNAALGFLNQLHGRVCLIAPVGVHAEAWFALQGQPEVFELGEVFTQAPSAI